MADHVEDMVIDATTCDLFALRPDEISPITNCTFVPSLYGFHYSYLFMILSPRDAECCWPSSCCGSLNGGIADLLEISQSRPKQPKVLFEESGIQRDRIDQ